MTHLAALTRLQQFYTPEGKTNLITGKLYLDEYHC